jgi:RecA/RadA recombinase
MDNERKQRLLETMKKINKDQGQFMDFAENLDETEVVNVGIPSIDKFIGGFKKGAFSIVYGGMSCGKSTLALQTIANAQKENKVCCYLDMERSFSKERATQLGVNLSELILVSTCQTAEEALEIVRTLSKDKVCDFLVLDSIQSMSPQGEQENKGKQRDLASAEMAQLARTLSKFFRVVSPDVFKAKMAVLLIGQIRMNLGSFIVRGELSGGEALKHFSYQTIFMRRGQGADAPSQKVVEYFLDPDSRLHHEGKNIPCGFDAVLKLTKTKSSTSALENSEIHLPFMYQYGFVDSVPQDDEQIKIEGTIDEQMEIRKRLMEKGILPNITIGSGNVFQDIGCSEPEKKLEEANKKINKEEKVEPPIQKKKGRPKKENK